MNRSDPALVSIVERASTLAERRSGAFATVEGKRGGAAVEQRLSQWCEVVAKGEPSRFLRRLAFEGLDLEAARELLAPVEQVDPGQLPAWAHLLARYFEALAPAGAGVGKPIAGHLFEDLLHPLVVLARQDLQRRTASLQAELADQASKQLDGHLLAQLSRLAAPVLQQRSCDQELTAGGMRELLTEYSVLARLLATCALQWTEASAEFIERLATDRHALEELFGSTARGPVVALELGLSEAHQHGRSVIALTFAGGARLVYKPRSLGLDRAYSELLGWLESRGGPSSLRRLQVLDRQTHGWSEFVEHTPCAHESEVREFYERAGTLLCLMYVLGAGDMHYENIVACGAQPIPIDLETLLQPVVAKVSSAVKPRGPTSSTHLLYEDSVLRTGLLPIWHAGPGGEPFDMGGLSGGESPRRGRVGTQPQRNQPLLDGIRQEAGAFLREIVRGFQQMYLFLLAHKRELLAADGPLALLRELPVRFIFRPSNVYSHVLRRSLRAEYLRDGTARSVQLELLSRGLLEPPGHPLWPLLRSEVEALERMDIPLFRVKACSSDLELDGIQVERAFARSGVEAAERLIAGLGAEDLEQQLLIVRNSFGLRYPALEPSGTVRTTEAPPHPPTGTAPEREWMRQAIAIAEKLQRHALTTDGGQLTWITMTPVAPSEKYRLNTMDHGLYTGTGGVALFMAAMARVTGRDDFRQLAHAAIQPLRRALQEPASGLPLTEEFGIGGTNGGAAALYTLVCVGRWLNDSTLLDDATHLATQLTRDLIAADRHFDLLLGAAGTAISLLALQACHPSPEVLERAVWCGEHLLAHQVESPAGGRAWPTLHQELLTGFSHGAAGIAYALFRLHLATGISDFHTAAANAVRYEQGVFSHEAGNWPDLRKGRDPKACPPFLNTWCHGAPGIGLARVGSLAAHDTPEIHQDIARAVDSTRRTPLAQVDHLCCGNLGIVDVLLTTGLRLARPELVHEAHHRASWTLRRAQENGSFRLIANQMDGLYNPGLYPGTAGIGYQFLRLAHPTELPSILLWE